MVSLPCGNRKSRVFVSDIAQDTRRGPVGASYLCMGCGRVFRENISASAAAQLAAFLVNREPGRISRLSRVRGAASSREDEVKDKESRTGLISRLAGKITGRVTSEEKNVNFNFHYCHYSVISLFVCECRVKFSQTSAYLPVRNAD